MSEKFKMERFGRYLLLDHLVDGGMAKICRARFLGEQANKIVAIKMIQPQFSNDPAFVQMFKDELKVAFSLSHPNIAQTYDYGEVNQTLYTAMEYVDGQNLKQFLDRLKKKKYVFPVEISTFIISQVCQALFYAHTFTDKLTGQSYKIIHRDISPHNIMITYDGAVKVIDFGIAKAETNSEATQAGTIKGKLSYLAPEYLEGLELDHRYDQFTVGITLWEMLCGRKLFTAGNDLAVLKEVQACKIARPSSINPNVPKELDEIVIKALQKDRSARFKDMDALNRALVRFLYSNYPEFNATDLSYFAKELFKDHIRIDRDKLKEFGRMDITPYLNDYEKSFKKSSDESQVVDPSTVEALIVNDVDRRIELEIDLDEDKDENIEKDKTQQQVVMKATQTKRRAPHLQAQTSLRKKQKMASPTQLSYHYQEQKKKTSPLLIAVSIAAIMGLAFYDSEFISGLFSGSQTQREIASTQKKLQVQEGYLSFENYDPMMNIYINGKKVTYSPLGITVPIKKDLKVEIHKKGHDSFVIDEKVETVGGNVTVKIPKLHRRREGVLSTSREFPEGAKLIYYVKGNRHELDLPLDRHPMPVGSYKAIIVDPVRKKKATIQLVIDENKEHILR